MDSIADLSNYEYITKSEVNGDEIITPSMFEKAKALIGDYHYHYHFDHIKSYIKKHPGLIKYENEAGHGTLLHFSIFILGFSTSKILLEAGADANATNRYGETPLSIACKLGWQWREPYINLLVLHGANVNGTYYHLAEACHNDDTSLFMLLFKHGADVNIRKNPAYTCLTGSILHDNREIFHFLIRNGYRFERDYDEWLSKRKHFTYYKRVIQSLIMQLILCSSHNIPRLSKQSKLTILPMDIIRKLCVEYLNF